jgi:hypothetical protein
MPHVDELHRAPVTLLAAALGISLCTGCMEPARKPPLLDVAALQEIVAARSPATSIPAPRPARADDMPDDPPLATTGVSLRAGRRT